VEKMGTLVPEISTGYASGLTARDGPENLSTIVDKPVEIFPQVSAPATPLIPTAKRATATGGKRVKKPSGKAAKKPHQPSGYEWRREGAGWDLRKVIYVDTATGGKQRKMPYLAHLSKSAFAEMKRKHKGKALDAAIQQWIKDKEVS
jgi:hypothetical protein